MAEVQSAPSPRPAWQRRLASLPAAIGHQLFPWFAHRSEQGTRYFGFVPQGRHGRRRCDRGEESAVGSRRARGGCHSLRRVLQWPNGGPGCPGRHRRGRSLSRRAALERRRQDGQCAGVPPERHVRQDRQEQGSPEPAQRRGAVRAAGRRRGAGGAEGRDVRAVAADPDAQAALEAQVRRHSWATSNAAAALSRRSRRRCSRRLAGEEQAAMFRKMAGEEQAACSGGWRTRSRRRSCAGCGRGAGGAAREAGGRGAGGAVRKLASEEQAALMRRLAGDEQAALIRRLAGERAGGAHAPARRARSRRRSRARLQAG